jgi:hypothetical protein
MSLWLEPADCRKHSVGSLILPQLDWKLVMVSLLCWQRLIRVSELMFPPLAFAIAQSLWGVPGAQIRQLGVEQRSPAHFVGVLRYGLLKPDAKIAKVFDQKS